MRRTPQNSERETGLALLGPLTRPPHDRLLSGPVIPPRAHVIHDFPLRKQLSLGSNGITTSGASG
jgi:hypothetical protein